jgi:hypothetical protein
MSFRGKPHNLHTNLFKASSDEMQHGYNMALDSQQLPSMSYVVALYRVKNPAAISIHGLRFAR